MIQLGNENGIAANGGGNAIIQYYDKIPKIIEGVSLEQEEFNVEIITNSKIDKFNFDQESKIVSFQIIEKNKFVTVTIEKELLGAPYTILLNDKKIKYTISVSKENFVSLSMKPQVIGEIVISGSEYIDGLTKITSNDTLPVESESITNDYFIWLVFGSVLIIVAIVVIIIIRKIKK